MVSTGSKASLIAKYLERFTKIAELQDRMPRQEELPVKTEWFNTAKPLLFKDQLKGKIVVIDFWSSCCINCIHVLQELERVEHTFKDRPEIAFIGCHSAKFENEQEAQILQRAVLRFNIRHSVFNDRDFKYWRANGVNSWPTIMVIGPDQKPILKLSGEDNEEHLTACLEAGLKYYEGKLNTEPLGLELEQDKLQNKGGLRPEEVKAMNQNLNHPGKVSVVKGLEAGDVMVISDSANNRLVLVHLETLKCICTIGSGVDGYADGDFKTAQFSNPQGVCLYENPAGEKCLIVCDTRNHLLREVNLVTKAVRTIGGLPKQRGFDRYGGGRLAEQAIASPWDIVQVDTQSFYVCMAGTHQIWKLDLLNGTLTNRSGTGAEQVKNGRNESAAWAQPSGIATGQVNGEVHYFVADSESSSIRAFNENDRVIGMVGATPEPRDLFAFGDKDGSGFSARLQHPAGVHYSEVDKKLYVADTYNHKIKVIDLSQDISNNTFFVNSWVGETTKTPSLIDGSKDTAQLHEPYGLWVYSKDGVKNDYILLADTSNSCIRKVSMEGQVETLEMIGIPPGQVVCEGDACKPFFAE